MPSGTAKIAVNAISQSEPRMPARKPVSSGRSRELYSVNSCESKRGAPWIAVSMISTSSTITPKNSENHRQHRKISEPGVRSCSDRSRWSCE